MKTRKANDQIFKKNKIQGDNLVHLDSDMMTGQNNKMKETDEVEKD